ncbi:MAG: hypothetical protein RBQ97_05915 [Acholeplasma sp.]|nr:hypothetical protein [Acholeplasma sp.]
MLKNKNILFIAPSFFGYEIEIKNHLVQKGAIVDYLDDRMNKSVIYKILNRVKFPFIDLFNSIMFNKKIKFLKEDYDYIFIIKCESVSIKSLKKLHDKYVTSVFILYLWDSISNVRGIENKFSYFDRIYSFDITNCKSYPLITYRPLFFSNKFMTVNNHETKILYDASFIGTDHGDRKKIIEMLLKKNSDLNVFIYMYSPSKAISFVKRLFRFKNMSLISLNYSKMSFSEIIDIISKSNVVIDIHNKNQDGLTMRTIEAFALNKKIITTNKSIVYTDIYGTGNVLVMDRYKPQEIREFLDKKFLPYNEAIKSNYSISSFISFIFEEREIL